MDWYQINLKRTRLPELNRQLGRQGMEELQKSPPRATEKENVTKGGRYEVEHLSYTSTITP
jgi:hypothetical protein